MLKPIVSLGAVLCLASLAQAGTIRGEYLEARTADIYTGPCFSNAEIFNTGHQALVAWKVTEGQWNGVDLSGLSVAAAIRGTTTFSEDRPEQAQSVLIVDRQASPDQRAALIDMAKTLGGKRLSHVVKVLDSTIALTVESHELQADRESKAHDSDHAMPRTPLAYFWVPGLAEVATRSLEHTDHVCGNESVTYPPLSRGVEALPAYTLGNRFQAKGLGTTWNDPNCRSSFVGSFQL